jgi:uncharacterized membrane protein YraQ (UPF0718 family)
MATTAVPQRRAAANRWGALVTIALALALIGYKAAGATARLRSGVLPHPLAGGPLHATWLYLGTIWPALAFGVLIAAALRTLVPPSVLQRLFMRGALRSQLSAAAAATPLMLCSCCAAPLYVGVLERTRRAGPALALLLGAPSLNLAAISFTFLLFGPRVGLARVAMALVAVVAGTAAIARLVGDGAPDATTIQTDGSGDEPVSMPAFVGSIVHVTVRTAPFIVVGALASAAIASRLSPSSLHSDHGTLVAIIIAATVAVPLALPTFFELPLAIALLGAGLPAGVAAAVLFAGPAVNLPSLLTVARASSWRVAAAVALAVWLIAVAGGLTIQLVGG